MPTERIHTDGLPAPWWFPADACIAKILFFTRNVGSPHAETSCASGSERQISRKRVRWSRDGFKRAFLAGAFLSVIPRPREDLLLVVFFFLAAIRDLTSFVRHTASLESIVHRTKLRGAPGPGGCQPSNSVRTPQVAAVRGV